MNRNGKATRLILAVVLLTAGVSGAFALINQPDGFFPVRNSGSDSNQNVPSNCTTSFATGLQIMPTAANIWTGLVLHPPSIAKLCVTWFTTSRNLKVSDFNASIYNVTVIHYASGDGFTYVPAPNINLTWDASSVHSTQLNDSTSSVTVVYTITASSDAHGFYTLSFPNNCPSFIPFAVVGISTNVSSSNFPQSFFALRSCPLQGSLSIGRITGYYGLNTVSLTA